MPHKSPRFAATSLSRRSAWAFAVCPALAIFFGATALRSQDVPVRVWQDSIGFPTYAEGDPDPVPQFSIYTPVAPNYPYPVRSRFTQDRRVETWRVLNLENEYLKCRFLPDFGGHLYSCVDKRNGRDMFYPNPALKKGPIGLRGAWVPMGIESNFPAAHARDSASPVDFAWRRDADGSGRVILENLDRVSGMRWRVDYVLRPGRAEIEQQVTLHNASDARQPYLWWANAGVTLDDPATRFILPTYLVKDHGDAPVDTWPVSVKGRDESVVAGHTEGGAARFAYGTREPFMAVYKPGLRSGVAHYADASVVTGKKTFLWGPEDNYVRRELTDNFPSYVEIQAGLFLDQETHGFLEPQQTRAFTEYWIPIRDLGGVSRVTPRAIVNLERRTQALGRAELLMELAVTETLKGAVLRLRTASGNVAWEAHADLSPAIPYAHALENPEAAPYTFELADAAGKIVSQHTMGRYDADTASERKPETKSGGPLDTEALALARGEENELNQHWKFALNDYSDGMRRFPSSVALRKAAGRLDVELRRYDEAADLLARVRAESPGDAEVAYLLGVAQARRGNVTEARTALIQVPGGSPFSAAAALELAGIAARAGDFAGALAALQPALGGAANSAEQTVDAGRIEVALLRRSGRVEEAAKRLAYWRGVDPADTFLRFEQTRAGADDAELWTHLAADAERVIDIADEYMKFRLYEDAVTVLSRDFPTAASGGVPTTQVEPGAVPPSGSPLVSYYRAYSRLQLSQDASVDLRTAALQSARYAFPYRASSIEVLRGVEQADPSDALAHLLAGRYYMNALMDKEAIGEWDRARKLNAQLPEVHRDLGKALREINHDYAGSMAAITEGLRSSASPELRAELDATRAALGTPARGAPVSAPAILTTPAAPTKPTAAEARATSAYAIPSGSILDVAEEAMLKAASGNADEAARMFDPKLFDANREPDDVRRAYIEVQMQRLLVQARQRRACPAVLDGLVKLGDLDTNLPFTFYGFGPFMKAAHFQYYAGVVEAACGNMKDARKRWARVAKQSEGLPSPEFVFPLLANARSSESGITTLQAVLASLEQTAPAEGHEAKPVFDYVEGMLLDGLGRTNEAEAKLVKASSATNDVMLRYLAGVALGELTAKASAR